MKLELIQILKKQGKLKPNELHQLYVLGQNDDLSYLFDNEDYTDAILTCLLYYYQFKKHEPIIKKHLEVYGFDYIIREEIIKELLLKLKELYEFYLKINIDDFPNYESFINAFLNQVESEDEKWSGFKDFIYKIRNSSKVVDDEIKNVTDYVIVTNDINSKMNQLVLAKGKEITKEYLTTYWNGRIPNKSDICKRLIEERKEISDESNEVIANKLSNEIEIQPATLIKNYYNAFGRKPTKKK